MTSLLPEVEGWIKLAGAFVAVLMALAVPLRSWIVEDRRYRSQASPAGEGAGRQAVANFTSSMTLADSLALASLAHAIDRLAGVLETIAEASEARDKDRLTKALERFLEREGGRGG